jgi:enamine deaminase RidA (YjgF/YER057c/UK114 family)
MQSVIQSNLDKLNIQLTEPPAPGGNYVSVNVVNNIAYVAIQMPKFNGEFLYRGRLGQELTSEDGYKAAELCAINVLSVIKKHVGFDKIYRLNHFDAYYQAGEGWDDAPKVVNGASDLFLKAMGEDGKHSRAIFGVQNLPKNFCIGITATFTLH